MCVCVTAYGQYIQQQYHMMRNTSRHRPQLPDYQSATQAANLQRRKLQYSAYHARSRSYDGVITDVMADQQQGGRQSRKVTSEPHAEFYMMGQDDDDENEELVDGGY